MYDNNNNKLTQDEYMSDTIQSPFSKSGHMWWMLCNVM